MDGIYETLAALAGGRMGAFDTACPECGPDRKSAINRKRRVLRVWVKPDFAGWNCTRCGSKGGVRRDDAKWQSLKHLRKNTDQRNYEYSKSKLAAAQYLWGKRQPAEISLVANYLRECRGYGGPFPATLGFLPPLKPKHHPAMIATFGIPDEPEPGVLSISADQVRGVHLTFLKPDGSAKAGIKPDKIMVGPSNGWPLVLAPMNDALGLIICEGIETGLSLHEATGCGVWAAGAAGRMPALADKVPDYTDCITIAGEPDPAGRKGAAELKKLLRARGLYCELRILGGEEAQAA